MTTYLYPLLIFFNLLFNDYTLLEGKWKLESYGAFYSIINSKRFQSEPKDRQEVMSQSMQFALDNTFYEFKKDSVFFTDAGANIIKHKTGRWLVLNDTLTILESGKIKAHRFFIVELEEETLKMKIVDKNGGVGKSELVFTKID